MANDTSNCCDVASTCVKTPKAGVMVCPLCGERGKPVSGITLQSLLKPDVVRPLEPGLHYFCSNPPCDVVYYSSPPARLFRRHDLIVRVGIKEKVAPRPVCYCFDHTIEEITEEIDRCGRTGVLDDIKIRMKTACWCETKNPQGSCCLATVRKCVQTILAGHVPGSVGRGSGPSRDPAQRAYVDKAV
jgi:hypothetical protein